MADNASEVSSVGQPTVSKLPESLSDAYYERMGKNLELTDSQKVRLKGWLKKRIDEWKQDTKPLHRMLEEDNDLVEGYVDETDFPWPDASNVHVDVTGIYMEVFQSTEKRSILAAESLWSASTDIEELEDHVADIEEYVNRKAFTEWNISKSVPMALWAKNRDGLCAVQITWDEDWEKVRDIFLIESEQDFLAEFPTPEDSNLSPEEWNQRLEFVRQNAGIETPVEIPVTIEKRTYYGNRATIVERIDFVTFPATAQTIYGPSCRGYGKRFRERKEEIRRKVKDEVYYKDAKKLLESKPSDQSVSSYMKSKDWIQGLNRSSHGDEPESFELVVKGRLDGESGEEEKLLVVYNHENDILMRCIEYPYRVDYYALFELNKRPNQLGGVSIPRKTRDMNDEIDTQHNQRINARTITEAPVFIGDPIVKKDWDPNAPENRWKPGMFIWTKNWDKLTQMKNQPTDLGTSMAEEANDFRVLDLSLGAPASLFSGQAPQSDPDAPGNKTALLLSQGNMRMEDPLMEDREGVAMMGKICLSHLYQFGPPILELMAERSIGGQTIREKKSIRKKILRHGINIDMKGLSVIHNPDTEMAKAAQLHQLLLTEPEFAQDPELRINSLRDVLRAGRVPGRDRKLPKPEDIQRRKVETQKTAMKELAQEQALAKQKAQEDAFKKRLQNARNELAVKSLSERLTDQRFLNNETEEAA